jgi:hypothetical protein
MSQNYRYNKKKIDKNERGVGKKVSFVIKIIFVTDRLTFSIPHIFEFFDRIFARINLV